MSTQISLGDHSPNIEGDGNINVTGKKGKVKVSPKSSIINKQTTISFATGLVTGIIVSFLGSYLVTTCEGPSAEPVQTTVVEE